MKCFGCSTWSLTGEGSPKAAKSQDRGRTWCRGRTVETDSLTLGQYLDGWTPSSPDYVSLVNCHIKPGLGQYPLAALDRKTVSQWANGLKKVGNPKAQLAVGTKKRALRCLHKVYEDAILDGCLSRNPCVHVKVLSSGEDERKV